MKFQPWIVESLSKRSRVWRSIIRTVEHAWHGKVTKPVHPTVPDKKDKAAKTHGPTEANTTTSPPQVPLAFSSFGKQAFFKYTLPLLAATKKSLIIMFSCPATTLTTRLTKHLIAFPHSSPGVGAGLLWLHTPR